MCAFIAERISTGKSGNCRHLVLIGPPEAVRDAVLSLIFWRQHI